MENMADDTASCSNGRTTTSWIVVIISCLCIVANSIVVAKSGHSRIKKHTVLSLRILCGASIVQVTMTTVCTCLATFTCSLDNTIACVLQGVSQRLVRMTVHLSFTVFFKNSLFDTLPNHSSRSMVKIVQILVTIAWLIIAVMSSLPLFATTSYRPYSSLFACDIAELSVLVTSDSFVFCMPALAVLAMSLYKLTSGHSRSLEQRISYVVGSGRLNIQAHEDFQEMKRVAKAGVVIAAALFLEWTIRIAAVLGNDSSSKYLLTLSLFFMLTNAMWAPSCLLFVPRYSAVHISSREGYGTRWCSPQETNFNFPPHIADFQSVPSSPEVNRRPADLRLTWDLYRRCVMQTPLGHLPNTHPRRDVSNPPLTWSRPNERDLRTTPVELDFQNTPPGRSCTNTPPGRSCPNTPLGRSCTNTPLGRSCTSTPPGRSCPNTPLGRSCTNTPLGRHLQNTRLGRDLENTTSEVIVDTLSTPTTPDPASLKRHSVSCQLSVGSWITNVPRTTPSAALGAQNNVIPMTCPDGSEQQDETGTWHGEEA